MSKKRLLSVVSAIISVFFVATLFAGFTMATKTKAADQTLVYNLASDPKTVDISLSNAVDASNVDIACFEGLTRAQKDGKIGPGASDKWTVSKDGKVYTFHIRSNAKWSDGKPVTANDFYFSWTRLMDPNTAADYSYQTFYIKGAEDFFNKKGKLSDVGLKVVNPSTFQVTLKAPTPYFVELCSWANFCPQREDIVKANPTTWANKPETFIGNGPFKLTAWRHNDSLEFAKNPNYWNAKNIKLTSMKWTMMTDSAAYMMAYEKGDVDLVEAPPASDIPKLQKEGKLSVAPYIGTYYMELNTRKAPFNNVKFRQALALSINRQFIIDAVLKAGQVPAGAMVPNGLLQPNGKDFRAAVTPSYYNVNGDLAKAKQLLQQSGVDVKKLDITLLYNTSNAHKSIAEALQQMWKQNLGINVKLGNQEWAVFQATRTSGNFQIARAGWIGDYSDPMTFLDMWTSYSGQNDPKWSNTQYDALIAQAKNETDLNKRMTEMHKAEDILMKEMPIIPIYFYTNTYCISDRVKGFLKVQTGGNYFDYASIQ